MSSLETASIGSHHLQQKGAGGRVSDGSANLNKQGTKQGTSANTNVESPVLPGSKISIIQRVRDFQVERKSERFYRLLHGEVSVFVSFAGSLCVIFHLFVAILREVRTHAGTTAPLQVFSDALLRLFCAGFLCAAIIRKPPTFWHAGVYFWLALNLWAFRAGTNTKVLCGLIGGLSMIISILIAARELRFFYESPRLYRAFAAHSSFVGDERGRILFYNRLKLALVDAGATPTLEQQQIHILLDGLEIFERSVEDSGVILEEIYISFEQFARLVDSYGRLCAAGVRFGTGNSNAAGSTKVGSSPSPGRLSSLADLPPPPLWRTSGNGSGNKNSYYNNQYYPNAGGVTRINLEDVDLKEAAQQPEVEA